MNHTVSKANLTLEKQVKNFLKKIKLSESTISTIFGAIVVVVVGLLVFNYIKQGKSKQAISDQAATNEADIMPATHKIVSGESLWTISEKYYGSGYNWTDIAAANKIDNPDMISEGQEIVLPKINTKNIDVAQTEIQTAVITAQPTAYTVKEGDDLWDIALNNYSDGYKWSEIAQANNLANPDILEVGQQLTLPR